jgi:hypothetical protein
MSGIACWENSKQVAVQCFGIVFLVVAFVVVD